MRTMLVVVIPPVVVVGIPVVTASPANSSSCASPKLNVEDIFGLSSGLRHKAGVLETGGGEKGSSVIETGPKAVEDIMGVSSTALWSGGGDMGLDMGLLVIDCFVDGVEGLEIAMVVCVIVGVLVDSIVITVLSVAEIWVMVCDVYTPCCSRPGVAVWAAGAILG
jgi:hypothetical protein